MIVSSRRGLVPAAVLLLLLTPCAAGTAGAQYFGRNKVQYDREDVRVLGTEHFDIYYSSEDVAAAQMAARLAERWYARLSAAFDHRLRGRQPIVLYGSHRRFEQTNVYQGLIDESTGGFTDSRRRRVVLPFSGSIADTDHVLGHEIVHAFQFDIADQHRSTLAVPLWFVEGMAEFLTLGPGDAQTAMWMRDAVAAEQLPTIAALASGRYFPYRWGAALWAYLASQYGEDLPGRALRAKRDIGRRLQQLTGLSLDELTKGWHETLRAQYAVADADHARLPEPILSRRSGGGRLNLAASLSPDGRRIIFLSERDQFSIDLFLAEADTGRTLRKLITTAASADFESLQYLHSAGAWNHAGTHFAIATVRRGRPVLLLLDIEGGSPPRELPLPQMDEVFSPTWSADDRRIAFSALKGGVTDLHVLDAATGTVRQLTRDSYSDLQPAWSPDGRTIAFATDRFTTRIDRLAFGAFRIGLLDVATGAVTAAPALEGANHLDPAWAPSGASLFFIADPDGVKNVYRMEHPGGAVYRITDVTTGVSGVTRSSPVLSVSSHTGAIAFSVFRRSGYDVHRLTSSDDLQGTAVEAFSVSTAVPQAPGDEGGAIEPVSPLPSVAVVRAGEEPYRSTLALEAIGSPYFSAGGGPYGGYVSGGASLLFGDLLGNQQLMTTAYISSRLDESAFAALYVNRTHRWNWGLTLEQTPELRLRTSSIEINPDNDTVLTRERERSIWTHRSIGGFAAYPLNRSRRLELSAGLRQIGFSRERRTEVVSRLSGMVVDRESQPLPAGPAISLAETGVALIGDTAIFGGTAPIFGGRYRFQAASAFGGLQYVSVLADVRRYLMPVRPFTLAVRAVHAGRYGQDADDIRLRDVYLGSPTLVRGYDAPAVSRSECSGSGVDCPALNTLLASRFAALKVELRIPVWSALNSTSRVRYGPIPMDAFLFADAGAGWGGEQRFGPGDTDGRWVRSAGAGVRVNAMGMIVELAVVRPLDLRRAGWSFSLNLRPGF